MPSRRSPYPDGRRSLSRQRFSSSSGTRPIRKQPAQYFGFLAHLAWPRSGMNRPPTPPNGALHNLQRGELGIRRWSRRFLEARVVPSRIARHISSLGDGRGSSGSSVKRVRPSLPERQPSARRSGQPLLEAAIRGARDSSRHHVTRVHNCGRRASRHRSRCEQDGTHGRSANRKLERAAAALGPCRRAGPIQIDSRAPARQTSRTRASEPMEAGPRPAPAGRTVDHDDGSTCIDGALRGGGGLVDTWRSCRPPSSDRRAAAA